MSTLFIFVDGLGVGRKDADTNPFAALPSKFFTCFKGMKARNCIAPGGCVIKPIDACLGVKGLPQSATGQTSLFAGVNAQKAIGRHLSAYPNPALRKIIADSNILKSSAKMGLNVTFANAYHKVYFERPPKHLSATTWVMKSSGAKVHFLEDLKSGKAVFHDLTNAYIIGEGYDVPKRTPEEAGRILGKVAGRFDVTLFEYVLTDYIGHKSSMRLALEQVKALDDLLSGVLKTFSADKNTILLSSDHGNIEDISVRTHTRNRVPLMVWGPHKDELLSNIRRISDVTPALLDLMSREVG